MEKNIKNEEEKLTDIKINVMTLKEKENFKEMQSSFIKNNEKENKTYFIENNEKMNSEDFSKTKINKPNELREFDPSFHFKENIINYNKNCKDEITESSYYCFTCKHSVCEKCGLLAHKEHLLIQRDSCLNFDKTFFNEISKVIDDSFLIENKREVIKNNIISVINNLKEELDNIMNKKLKEADNVFNEIKKNLFELKDNYSMAKLSIENYYNKNKTFFNISTIYSQLSQNEETEKDNNNILNEDDKNINNKDLENTIFLMNFELMNLCDNKNLQVLDYVNEMKYRINFLTTKIEQINNNLVNEINNYLDLNSCLIGIDDFYLDVKLRTTKYNEFINSFKKILGEIIRKNGNLDKLTDLVAIFDAKNRKDKNILFNQEYFINYNKMNISRNMNFENKLKSPKKNKVNQTYNNQKNIVYSPKLLIGEKFNESLTQKMKYVTNINNKNKKDYNEKKRKQNYYLPYNKSIKNNLKNKVHSQDRLIKDNKLNNNFHKTYSQTFSNSQEIILNKRIIQRFFSYSIYNLFSKYFRNQTNNNNDINSNDIEYIFRKKTVSFLSNYTERYNRLKEIAKPIIGTNQIQYFDSMKNQITKIFINLSKIDHGYAVFPFGCRHILIDNILYIVGGADNCGSPTNIVLSYDFSQNLLSKLPNLNDEHAYHSIDYLDNFDSIIVIGGENSSSCEIMDLDSKKWIRLPFLNCPRANTNIYYDIFNYELFALFGMEGEITEKNKNSDIIEVLDLSNIIDGWKKVNYYRKSGLNIKSNYCITLPFTKEKLLVYGCSSVRSIQRKLFAFFDMNKNECIKVDKETLELIKIEEKKMKSFDYELSKIE